MPGNEINIKLTDETSDKRFSDASTAKDAVKSATQTKTEEAKTGGNDPGIDKFKDLGTGAIDNLTGGGYSSYAKIASQAGPMAVAMLALSMVKQLHKQYRHNNQQLETQEHMRLRAGGSERGPVNVANQRVNIFTRRANGSSNTYVRR